MDRLRGTAIRLLPFFVVYLAAMGIEALLVGRRRAALRGYDATDTATNVGTWALAMAAWIPINVATYVSATPRTTTATSAAR